MDSRIALGIVLSLVVGQRLCAQEPQSGPSATQPSGTPPPQQPQPSQQPQQPQQPQQAQQPTPKGLQWQVGDYTVKFGGYVKLDLIHDFNQIGSKDDFDPRTIPTNNGESNPGMSTLMQAKETRFNVDVRGPTSAGPMRVFFEGDFFNSDSTFRIRHAYGEIEGLLAGQTWSTFMDETAFPETLDFESPIGFPSIRQAMVRYTRKFDDQGNYAAIALEDPKSAIITPTVGGTPVPGAIEEPIPDFTGRLYLKNEYGHAQLGLFAGAARFNPTAAPAQNAFLWGANLSTKIEVYDKDYAIGQVMYGPGIGRYRGGTTAAPDASGNIQAVEVFAVTGAYQHHWTDEWRSNVTYSWAKGNLPGGVPVTTTESVSYLAVNLIWQFCDKAWCGVEYLYGSNESQDDHRGEASRVQFSVRYNF
jgi:hypothetical protein